jgi:hypothetical protein
VKKPADKSNQFGEAANVLVNVFWSLLNLLPASIFCYKYIPTKLLITIGILSFLAAFIPTHILK